MGNRVGALRKRLFSADESAPTAEAMLGTVEAQLEANEFIHQHLLGKADSLTCKKGNQTETLTVSRTARPLVVLTDRKLLFAVVSPEDAVVRAVSYIDIKDVDVDDGLLRSTLTVDIWPEGTYQLSVRDSTALGAAVSVLIQLSECWQYVVSMLEAANDSIPTVGEAIETGELGTTRTARTEVETRLSRVRNRLEKTLDETELESLPALEQRIDSTETELYRTEMHARIARAATLMSEGKQHAESRAYTDAARQYWKARDHLENARMLARRAEIAEPSVIESRLETVENSIKSVRVRPLAQAKQTHERAEKTERRDVRIETLQDAFEHYQDALTAGWGTDFSFAGEKEAIRADRQEIIASLSKERCKHAQTLAERAVTHRKAGRTVQADKTAERARKQLNAAQQLASEFRAVDEGLVTETNDKIEQLLSH